MMQTSKRSKREGNILFGFEKIAKNNTTNSISDLFLVGNRFCTDFIHLFFETSCYISRISGGLIDVSDGS